jgi:hypothetical protein
MQVHLTSKHYGIKLWIHSGLSAKGTNARTNELRKQSCGERKQDITQRLISKQNLGATCTHLQKRRTLF